MNPVLSKIIELINSDNFYKAELEIRKIYPNNPQSFDLNKMLGLCLLAQRKYNSALKCFERCFSIKRMIMMLFSIYLLFSQKYNFMRKQLITQKRQLNLILRDLKHIKIFPQVISF